MEFAKSGRIHNLCYPNAIMTFKEYLMDYADDELKILGNKVIEDNLGNIPNATMRAKTVERLERIVNGERNLFF